MTAMLTYDYPTMLDGSKKPFNQDRAFMRAQLRIDIFIMLACLQAQHDLNKKFDLLIGPPKKTNTIFSQSVVNFFENKK